MDDVNLYRLVFGAQMLFYRGTAVGWIRRRSSEEVLARDISLHVLLIELATVIGFLRCITGRQTVHWAKAGSPAV